MTLLVSSAGSGIIHFGEIDSTNAEAHRRARQGERGSLWLVADRQTEGRGRHGRHWVSESGNLFATLLLTLSVAPAVAAQLSFVAGLAVFDTVRPFIAADTRPHVSLKWPNDVLIDGRKVAGILAESASVNGIGELAVVLGCGINVSRVPLETRYPATCLRDHGAVASRDEVLASLMETLSARLAAWSLGDGFEMIRRSWLSHAAGLGQRAILDVGHGRIEGVFADLAADGALILRLDNGEQRAVHGGEVTFAELERSRSPVT